MTAGRVDWERLGRKAYDLFVGAAGRAPQAQFAVMGKSHDDSTEYLTAIATSNITFTGWLSDDDLLRWLSRGEGYGRALAEAMYFGLPVIGADRGASKELVEHGASGFLFESGSDESLASHIFALYEDHELRRRFGKKGRDFIQRKANYDQDVGAQFYSILTRLWGC